VEVVDVAVAAVVVVVVVEVAVVLVAVDVVVLVVVGGAVVVVVEVVVMVVVGVGRQSPVPSQWPPVQVVPVVANRHDPVQQELAVPFAAPASHCSGAATMASPQTCPR